MNIYEICALLGYYAAYIVNSLLKFWESRTVPSSRVNKSQKKLKYLYKKTYK